MRLCLMARGPWTRPDRRDERAAAQAGDERRVRARAPRLRRARAREQPGHPRQHQHPLVPHRPPGLRRRPHLRACAGAYPCACTCPGTTIRQRRTPSVVLSLHGTPHRPARRRALRRPPRAAAARARPAHAARPARPRARPARAGARRRGAAAAHGGRVPRRARARAPAARAADGRACAGEGGRAVPAARSPRVCQRWAARMCLRRAVLLSVLTSRRPATTIGLAPARVVRPPQGARSLAVPCCMLLFTPPPTVLIPTHTSTGPALAVRLPSTRAG
jgi:hypothetical protein